MLLRNSLKIRTMFWLFINHCSRLKLLLCWCSPSFFYANALSMILMMRNGCILQKKACSSRVLQIRSSREVITLWSGRNISTAALCIYLHLLTISALLNIRSVIKTNTVTLSGGLAGGRGLFGEGNFILSVPRLKKWVKEGGGFVFFFYENQAPNH